MKRNSVVVAVCTYSGIYIAVLAGCTPRSSETGNTAVPLASQQQPKATPSISSPTPAASVEATLNTSGKDVIASVDGLDITREQLEKPLFEGYGVNMLAKVAQLALAHRQVQKQGIAVGPEDVSAESKRYLASLFNEDRDPVLKRLNDELEKAESAKDTTRADQIKRDLERVRNTLLEQLLQQQKVTRADFNQFIELNTYLRALATAQLKQQPISDEALRAAFNHLYGEKVQVADIQLANLQEATEAKRRLATEPFEQVAKTMSRDQQSALLGGDLPPFSRDTPGLPQQFKDVAFALKVGEVSDPVAAENAYHIVLLKSRIAPKVIKFEDVKSSVRDFLFEKQLEAVMKELRVGLQQEVLTEMKITEPTLREQFKSQVTHRDEELRDKTDIRREFDRRLQQERQSTTQPGTAPAAVPGPGLIPPVEPATQPMVRPTTQPVTPAK